MSDQKLFQHTQRHHEPQNVNILHKAEMAAAGFNQRLAVKLTQWVGSMACAWVFTCIAVIGLLGLLNLLNPAVYLLMQWLSQQFLQLVLLSVIMVGQGVLNRKQELQAEEAYQTTRKIYHETAQMVQHMHAQDAKILEILEILKK